MLVRAWLLMGTVSAALVMAGFLCGPARARAGARATRRRGRARSTEAYVEATTMTFLGIVACQVGTAFAARTERASLRAVGFASNRLLLWGIAFELAVSAALVTIGPLQAVFHTAVPAPEALLPLLFFPLVVWGVDEAFRAARRRRAPCGFAAPALRGSADAAPRNAGQAPPGPDPQGGNRDDRAVGPL